MALDIPLVLGLAGIFILGGYVSDYIFRRFGFPDIVILLGIGILIGPASGLVSRADVIELAPLLTALVLTIILFNGGLDMNYDRMIRGNRRAAILAATTFVLSLAATMLITRYMLGLDPLMGLLLGAILGGISATMVVPLAGKLGSSQRMLSLFRLESAYMDVIVIMVSVALVQVIAVQAGGGAFGFASPVDMAMAVPIGAAIGIGGGLAWIRIKSAMKSSYEDIITLAIAFALYGLSEYVGGSGAVAALAFGITFGSASKWFRPTKDELPMLQDSETEASSRKFHSQIAFMVRAILFIFLGSILTINSTGIVIAGIVIALMLFFPRIGAAWISTHREHELRSNVWLISFMLPRGLAAGAAALLPLLYSIGNSAIFMNLVTIVVISTIAISTIGINLMTRVPRRGIVAPGAQRGAAAIGSMATTAAFQRAVIFTAIAFAVATAGAFAANISTNGQVFSNFAPAFEKGTMASDIVIRPVGGARTYFFDSSESERSAVDLYGPSGAISYKWEFGDGSTSRERQVVHQYEAPGNYLVKLVLVREDGVMQTESTDITVE